MEKERYVLGEKLMNKTNVKEHPRRKKKGGRTRVNRHNRTVKGSNKSKTSARKQFLRRKVKFEKSSYKTIEEIHQDYVNDANYEHPLPFTTNPHDSDMEMVLELPGDKREHHRIFDEGSRWKLESHIDLVSPTKDPYGHYKTDVKAPEDNPKLRKENFNDTQIIYLEKK